MRSAGAALAFGTDWPIVPLEPMLSVAAALYVGQPDERWMDQSQTLDETLSSYTTVGAYTEFAEDQKGQIKAGMLADLAVLSSDLENMDRNGMEQTQTVLSLCDGRLTYDAR